MACEGCEDSYCGDCAAREAIDAEMAKRARTPEKKVGKTPQEIIAILHSIKDVRLDKDEEIEVQFTDPDPAWKDGWEANAGFNPGSFTEQLLLLIEASLKGELT